MNKRHFIKSSILSGLSLLASPVKLLSEENYAKNEFRFNETLLKILQQKSSFELPKLGYETSALEPYIDSKTMEIHYGKHHAAYVKNLNDEITKSNLQANTLLELLQKTSAQNNIVRNNAGGHFNHTLFWNLLQANASENLELPLSKAIIQQWGSLDNFKKEFNDAAMKRFGSGWAWLCKNNKNELFICSTPNQDNPLMKKIVKKTGSPIIALDVWEHAYYLKYQNKRKDYVESFWKVLNWNFANELFTA